MYKNYTKEFGMPPRHIAKILLIMRLTTLMLIVGLLQVSAAGLAQKVSLTEKNAPLKSVLREIRRQSGYDFVYAEDIFKNAKPVNITLKNAELKDALEKVFGDQNLTYTINKNTITVKEAEPNLMQRVADALALPVDVRGTVVDEKGQPLPGVTVTVKGTNQRVPTDVDGKFYLAGVDDKATLVFTIIGYKPMELPVKAQLGTIQMEVQNSELQEVVVAYGKTTVQQNVSSLTVVKGEQIQSLPNRSFDKSLQGLVPGLQITGGTGQPGGGLANIVLRGVSTGTEALAGSTVRNPLIVIDGVPVSQDYTQFLILSYSTPVTNPLAQLNPSDIETISVLKDAAAIALYGSKASNGVILVTTKKGKSGKTTFGFRQQTDFASKPAGKVKLLNQQQYLELLYETFRNSGYTNQQIRSDLFSKFPYQVNGTDTSFYATPDWVSELYSKNAISTTNEISMSGGNEKNNFYLNIEYSNQNGIVKNTGYDRKSMRFNFENRPTSWLKIGVNSTGSYTKQKVANPAEDFVSYGMVPSVSPLVQIRKNGNLINNFAWGAAPFALFGDSLANPVAATAYNINQNVSYRGLNKFYGEISFLKYFNFSSSLGIDFMLSEIKEKSDPRLISSTGALAKGVIREQDLRRTSLISTNLLRFQKIFGGRNSVGILLGQEAQIMTNKLLGGEVRGTASALPYYDQLSTPGYTVSSLSGYVTRQALESYFAQANYGYDDKYLLTTSIRRDGSSKFGDQQQWGTYWSVGGGYVVSNEKFFKNNIKAIDYLKIRGSVGAAGNSSAIDARTRFDVLSYATFLNGVAVIPQTTPGNPNIKWEQTYTWDVGIEAKFFNERFFVTADIYNKKTNDLIYSVNLPSVTGYTGVANNIGDIRNRGIEFSISADIIKNERFGWTLTANWSTNENKLLKANTSLPTISGSVLANEAGRNFNSFYLRKWAGVNPSNGLPMWLDSLGNPNSAYTAAKREFVGRPQPTGYGAITQTFRYKNLTLIAQLYYQYGGKLYDQSLEFPLLTDGAYPYVNQIESALDRWQKPGDIAKNPRRMLNNSDRGSDPSTRYLFSSDYIRLQNLSLTYDFPKSISSKLHFSNLKILAQGNNLFIVSKFPGEDPDNSNVSGTIVRPYPNQRTISLGLIANF